MPEKIQILAVSSSEDYDKCLAIRRKVFIEDLGVPEEIEIDTYEKEAHHFLALYEDQAAATGRFRLKKGFTKFERIATLPAFRGKGIASVLMKGMQKAALEKYPEYLTAMHSQVDAIPFYHKLGWVSVGPVFREAEIDHQAMILTPKDPSKLNCLTDPETPDYIVDYLSKSMTS